MVKTSPRDADARIARPDPAIKAYLIFGPDRGLVHERANALAKALVPDPNDPFAVTQLTEEDLKSDPASLSDAMAAMSLTGGARLVRVRLSGETGSGPILELVAALEKGQAQAEACLVVESGDLTPRGKLRKLFEPARSAMAIACYADSAQSLADIATKMLAEEGLSLTSDARSAWLPRLEGDRAFARGEIEKLILFKGLKSQRAPGDDRVELIDVEMIAADQGDAALDAIIGPVLDGSMSVADSAYVRALGGGASAVGVLRALQRRLDQLGSVAAAGGDETAMARSGAPRYGPQAAQFRGQMQIWRGRRLDAARQLAFDAERAVKRSASPTDTLVGDLLLRLARGAARMRA
ncbi:DNA polymerase III subunit delta [Maricaulis sp.]|uniref:DNA polymerase III subunit delta n=1 Tax=Maricaulis sp. TaxID=1486257 RepID=UPI003A944CB0